MYKMMMILVRGKYQNKTIPHRITLKKSIPHRMIKNCTRYLCATEHYETTLHY